MDKLWWQVEEKPEDLRTKAKSKPSARRANTEQQLHERAQRVLSLRKTHKANYKQSRAEVTATIRHLKEKAPTAILSVTDLEAIQEVTDEGHHMTQAQTKTKSQSNGRFNAPVTQK